MLVQLRRRNVERGYVEPIERASFKLFGAVFSVPWLFTLLTVVGRFFGRLVLRLKQSSWLFKLLVRPVSGWTSYRILPPVSPKAFRQLWKKREGRMKS
jgi:hypothetical protein